MIQTEYLNDGTLVRHWSDKGVMLLQVETGAKYGEPIDVVPCAYTYEETDEYEDSEGGEEEISDDEFMDMLGEVL